jgi:type IV pilus assembly protein PilM
MPVEIVNPFNSIEINPKKFDLDFIREMAPVFNVAMGLALRAVGDEK